MNPFLPDEVEALRALVRTWPNAKMVVLGAAVVRCFIRFGLLAALAGSVIASFLSQFPISSNLSSWYAGPALFALAVVVAVSAYGFHCSLGGRSAFEDVLARE